MIRISATIISLVTCYFLFGQCPTTVPGGVDSCSITAASVQLGATGSTGYYNWYDASVGGNYLTSGAVYNTPIIGSTTTYYVSATNINTSLDFDGSNDYVSLGNPAALQITGDMTIEMWVKPDNFSARRNPYAKAYGGEGTITQEMNGTLSYYYGTNGGNGGPYQGFNSGTSLTLNEWNHIAIVRDLVGMQLYWYINGVLVNQTSAAYPAATAGGNTVFVGAGYVSNYDGQIDELRVWSSARTQSQIQNNMNLCLTGAEPNLAGYWNMDDAAGTVLIDGGPNAINGTLTNMDPATDWVTDNPGSSCPACESGRTAVTATIGSGIPVNLGSNSCVNGSTTLDAGAGYVSYLWQDASTNQTLNVTADGTYWVEVNDGTCSDVDTITISINAVTPTGVDSCSIGSASVQLGVSGSTGYYNWYDAASGGNFLVTGSTYNTPVISSTTTYYVAAIDTSTSLDFDGTNDYIALGNPSELQITGDLTIEMWVKPDNFSTRRNPYAKAYGGEGTITQETNGTLNFYYGTNGGNGSPYQSFNSGASLTLNEWNHIAIVRDLTGMQLYWYINGVLTNQTAASYGSATAGTNPVYIGAGYVSNYDGQIEEVRVWSSARTQTEIQNGMNGCCSCASDPNLNGYWKMDDGTGSTTASDATANDNTGTLTSMDPATDWVSDGPGSSCPSCESPRVPVVANIGGGSPIDLGNDTSLVCTSSFTLDAGAGYTSYLWQDASTGQTLNASAAGTYWVEVNDGTCADVDTIYIRGAGGSGFALDFDGTNDYIALGNPSELQITGDLTIEMWLKPDNFSTRRNPYAKAYGGEGTITQETNGTLNFYYGTNGGNGSPYQGFNSGASLTLNEWNHIAIVRDLTGMQLYWYINGVLTNQTAANYGSATAGTNPVYIGDGYVSNYDGQIEEVRVWSSARTQSDIRDYMCKKLIGSETGLAGYYRFDDASGTTLSDLSKSGNDGTLTNMAPASDWVVSSASIGDESIYVYPGSWAAQTLTLAHCSGENLTVSNMSGSPAGVHIYYVSTVPNDVTGIIGLGDNDRYFGVHKVNDATATYTATYDYTGNPYVNAGEADLLLFTRSDNAATPWADAGATLNTTANTLTSAAMSTEFILGVAVSALPVELISFEAKQSNDMVDLTWITATEIDCDYFTIQRSQDGMHWEDILTQQGAGNSSSVIVYEDRDNNPLAGVSYYKLLQTDFDGTTHDHGIVSVNFQSDEDVYVNVWPNPFDNGEGFNVQVIGMDGEQATIFIRDILGREIFTKSLPIDGGSHVVAIEPLNNIPSGPYLLTVSTSAKVVTKQIIVK